MNRIEGVACQNCLGDVLIPEKDTDEKSSAVGLPTSHGVVWFCSITCCTTHPLWTQALERERLEELEKIGYRKVNGARQTCFDEC